MALLGTSRVVFTDIETLFPGLINNVEGNELGDRIKVRQLVWGSDEWVRLQSVVMGCFSLNL